jgi:hypothetical protein
MMFSSFRLIESAARARVELFPINIEELKEEISRRECATIDRNQAVTMNPFSGDSNGSE